MLYFKSSLFGTSGGGGFFSAEDVFVPGRWSLPAGPCRASTASRKGLPLIESGATQIQEADIGTECVVWTSNTNQGAAITTDAAFSDISIGFSGPLPWSGNGIDGRGTATG